VQQLTRLRLTQRVARSVCGSWAFFNLFELACETGEEKDRQYNELESMNRRRSLAQKTSPWAVAWRCLHDTTFIRFDSTCTWQNTDAFCSAFCVSWQRDTARSCYWAPAMPIDIFRPPGPQQQTRHSGVRRPNYGTNRRTPDRYIMRYEQCQEPKNNSHSRKILPFNKHIVCSLNWRWLTWSYPKSNPDLNTFNPKLASIVLRQPKDCRSANFIKI